MNDYRPVHKLRLFFIAIQAGWRMFKHSYSNMKANNIYNGDTFVLRYALTIEFGSSKLQEVDEE